MHVVCCIKQVPDTAEVKIDPETNTLIRAGVESIANPYDMVALEAALSIKDRYGGRVTAVSMGPPQAEEVLREAIALGADQAVLLSDRAFAGADTLATGYTLTKAIEHIGRTNPVDLILCGKQAIDGDTAQVGPGVATGLGYTQLTYVVKIREIDEKARTITVERKVEGGSQVVRGVIPAVLTCELDLAKPRRASLPRLMHSIRIDIPVWNGATIEADPDRLGLKGSPTWVRKIFSPPLKQGGPLLDARDEVDEAVEKCLSIILLDETFASKLLKREVL
ncbi:MAG TPA: electron transfer flavoprotein subunit beta/FixA family protein [Syntrophorhabdaceae bacterium]|nr:electron transfer flavoprotein subunit beta/FixA family protein [Syntrophorhabdaceae bacterium]